MSAGATLYPNLVFDRVSQSASIGTLPFNQIQTAIMQIERDMYNAKQSISTLATFINNALNADGTLATQAHSNLIGIASNQHHLRLHQDHHRKSKWESRFSGVADSTGNMAEHNNAIYLAGYEDGERTLYKSLKGDTWTEITANTDGAHGLISSGNYIYSGGEKIMRSLDGDVWTEVEDVVGLCTDFVDFTVDSKLYAFCASSSTLEDSRIYSSTDGETWTLAATIPVYALYKAIEFDGYMYAFGYIGTDYSLWRSNDGTTWADVYDSDVMGTAALVDMVEFDSEIWVSATGTNIFHAADGVTWTAVNPAGGVSLLYHYAIGVYDDTLLVSGYRYADGYGNPQNFGWIMATTDGTTWAQHNSLVTGTRNAIRFLEANNRLFASVSGGAVESMDKVDSFWASATEPGLINTNLHKNVEYGATQATKNDWEASGTYTGSGGAGARHITCSFRPAIVMLAALATAGATAGGYWSEYEMMDGMTFAIQHAISAVATLSQHYHPRATHSIKIVASGFDVGSVLNGTSYAYGYVAIKGD